MTGPVTAVHQPNVLQVTLRCDLADVRPAVQMAHDFLAKQGWQENDLMSFDLALVEACNNAIKYAGESGRQRPVVLEAVCQPAQVEFRVHDHTPGFAWPKKIALPEPESESGRGLYLINSLTDHAGYFRGQDGNVLVMRKNRPQLTGNAVAARTPGSGATVLDENERIINDLVEELSSCYESLSAIFRYSAHHGGSANPKEFAERLLADLLGIVPAEWFILRLADKNNSRLDVLAASSPTLQLQPLMFPAHGEPAKSVEIQAALARKRVWFNFRDRSTTDNVLARVATDSAGMVHPILLGEQFIGTLTLGRKSVPNHLSTPADWVFSAAQANVVNTFADFLAVQIANTRLREEQVNQRLVSHELDIARNIQRSLLPATLPQLPALSLAAFCRSAREVGGDFYDVLQIDPHSRLLVIADVMGKGIPAAMFAAILRSLLRAAPELARQPGALLGRVNGLLYPDLSAVDMFITAQLAFVDGQSRKMVLAGAGHCPVVMATSKGVKTFSPEGMPLGILPDTVFHEETVELPENCRVLLYTDGLTEAHNAKNEFFGQARLLDLLQRSTAAHQNAEQFRDTLAAELDAHQQNTTLNDDQTFLILAAP